MPEELINILNKGYIDVRVVDKNSSSPFISKIKPERIVLYPKYINCNNHIYYNGLEHYQCDINMDVINLLEIMNNPNNEQQNSQNIYNISFRVKDHIAYFEDKFDFYAYIMLDRVRKFIKENYDIIESKFIEPDTADLSEFQSVVISLTPKEYLKIYYLIKKEELRSYKDHKRIQVCDVRRWLNCLTNYECHESQNFYLDNLFDEELMGIINNLLETKRQVYYSFYDLAKKSSDIKYSIESLFKCLNKNSELNDLGFNINLELVTDILVQFIGLDKIETQAKKTITTSRPNINLRYRDLILDGYKIVQLPHLQFDENTQEFKYIYPDEFINYGMDREIEEEIKLIKK